MPREQGESGEFVETIAPEDVLDVFDAVDGPVILSADVADHFGVTRETARRKLKQLSDRGVLDRRKVSRRVIYWRADPEGLDAGDLRGDPSTTLADTDTEQDAPDAGGSDATETTAGDRNGESGRTRAESDTLDAALAELDTTDARRDAVRACVEYLREHGTGQRSDFLDAVYPEHAAGFGSKGGWWNKIGKEYLNAVATEYDPVTPPAKEGSHTWRWDP